MNHVPSILGHFLDVSEIKSAVELDNAGGFSGAKLWKIVSDNHEYALRRWPTPHPDRDRLSFIHAVQNHFVQSNIKQVPRLQRLKDGGTFCMLDGAFWELSSWVPGSPTFHEHPSRQKLKSAMELLAALHNTAALLQTWSRVGKCPAIQLRAEMIESYHETSLARLAGQIDRSYPKMTERCHRIVDHAIRLRANCRQQLQNVHGAATQLFPCIKDIWHDHIFYTGDVVTGIVDFGTMNIDSPAGDIARLLGSLAADDQASWQFALDVYQAKRSLSDVELNMISALDWANVVFSGINWIRWLYVDRRTFADIDQIAARLNVILARQQTRLESL